MTCNSGCLTYAQCPRHFAAAKLADVKERKKERMVGFGGDPGISVFRGSGLPDTL